MEVSEASEILEALAHETRLAIVRMLIPAGEAGLRAGAISERLGHLPNTVSFHLARLRGTGLVRCRRQGRELYYAAAYARFSALVSFLVDDCCAAAAEGCGPACPTVPSLSGPTRAEKSTKLERS